MSAGDAWELREKHTIGDGRDKTVYGCGAVEEHAGGHGLLPHEVTVDTSETPPKHSSALYTPQDTRVGCQSGDRNADMVIYSVHLLLVRRKLSERTLTEVLGQRACR